MHHVRMLVLSAAFCLVALAPASTAVAETVNGITFPCAIRVVGKNGVTSANHTFEVLAPGGSEVCIDFSNCNGGKDPGPAAAQNAVSPLTVDCPTYTVCAVVPAGGGAAVFDIQGMASGAPIGTTPSGPCAGIWVDGSLVGTVQVAAFDLDGGIGGPGMTAADLSLFLHYFFNCPVAPYCAIADYNFVDTGCASQDVSAADFSLWLQEYLSTASVDNDPICP